MTAPLEIREGELLPQDCVLVASRRWDSNGARLCVLPEGGTLEDMVRTVLEGQYPNRAEAFYAHAMTYCRARLDGMEIKPLFWAEFHPQAGQRVEVLMAPTGGGGKKKNPLSALLSVVVSVAAMVVGQVWVGPALAGAMGITSTAGVAFVSGMAAGMMGFAASMAMNALFPVSQPAIPTTSNVDNSQTYSLNGGQNSANPGGYVPLVLGSHRMTPPLGGKSWTSYEGEEQFFHMLVVWGHKDVYVENFRIGDTPLGNYSDVEHVFHAATKGDDLELFAKSYNEVSVGAALTAEQGWVTRSVGVADELSFDIGFNALGKANKKSGNIEGYSVTFRAECAREGSDDWRGIGGNSFRVRPVPETNFSAMKKLVVWTSHNGVVSYDTGRDAAVPSGCFEIYPNKSSLLWGCDVTVRHEDDGDGGTRSYFSMTEGGMDEGNFVIGGSQVKALTKTYRTAVPHGEWKMRLRRVSADTNDTYIYDDATWTVLRAIRNRPAFSTPEPICVSELRIRASEQLSGYVSNFNADVTSFVPDWDGEAWTPALTDNPASLLRYLLTSRAGAYEPWSAAKLDEPSFVAFHQWCEEKGYTFNFIADTEMTTWKRLVQIAAAGRGNVTLDNDGKYSIIIDRADKVPVQMFTPRNSWGFSIERSYAKLPHALRAEFVNKANDYKTDNGFIYADGYNQMNATNIVEWKAEGKTDWNEVWKFGRYYLASMRLRPETVSLSTDWEWRLCRRGDLVGVAHDTLMTTFGTARVTALLYRVDGETVRVTSDADRPEGLLPFGVMLDDSVHFSELGVSYGIAFRLNTGRLVTLRLAPQYGEEAWELTFASTPAAAQVPPIGALCSVSILGEEYEEYLVAGITPGDNMSADLTLIPYAPEIVNADSGAIPAWTPSIRLDTVPKRDSLPVPTVKEIRTDESVIIRSGDSLISRIAAWYGLPASPDPELGEVQVQMQATDDFGGVFTATAPLSEPFIAVQGVEDGRQYRVALRLVSARGLASGWSEPHTVTVIGKTSTPPEVEGLSAAIADPQGVKLAWEAVTVADFDHYEVSGAASTKTVDNAAVMQVFKRTGVLSFAVQSVDTLGLKSDKVEASVEVLPPAAPAPVYTVSAQTGAQVSWPDCKTTWSIDHYEVEDLWKSTSSVYTDGRFTISPRPLASAYRFLIRAVDIFGNSSAPTDFAVTIGTMPAPVPAARVDGSQVVISWDAVAAPFSVEWYEVQSADGAAVGKVKSTELRFEALKAGTYSWRVRGIDIAGNLGPWGECSITLGAPAAPVLTVNLNEDLVDLAWSKPAADLPVVAYDVIRVWEETRADGVVETREWDYGRVDVQALSVPAMSVGTHTFMVRAVDNAGTTGPWGTADFVVRAPGRVTFFDCGSVDNNVMIYYTDPDYVFFPIREYLVEEIEDGLGMELGRTDAHFFADIRSTAGDFVYGITPVDVAGNLGQRNTMRIAVSPPPDFILFAAYDSLFNGTLTNMVLDGKGSMLGPYLAGETWQDNTARIAAITGKSADVVTWQDKIDSGNVYWLSPVSGPVCSYSDVLDVGFLVPQSNIKVQVEQNVLAGDVTMTCKIEVSEDGSAWRVSAEDALKVLETSFQFVRVTLTWTGGAVAVQHIFVDLNLKRKRDYGTAAVYAKDCVDGNGNLLPEAAIGTFVPFSQEFVVLDGAVAVDSVNEDTGLNAFAVTPEMVPGQYLPGFRAALFDKEGHPIDGEISWSVQGV